MRRCSLQQPKVAKSGNAQPPTHPLEDKDAAYYKQFLDKNGGYKDKEGGYYNPKAGTYTDKVGGVVDNWAGYTYKDGSYKSKLGDYYDSKENVFKLSDGQVLKPTPGMTPPQSSSSCARTSRTMTVLTKISPVAQ